MSSPASARLRTSAPVRGRASTTGAASAATTTAVGTSLTGGVTTGGVTTTRWQPQPNAGIGGMAAPVPETLPNAVASPVTIEADPLELFDALPVLFATTLSPP